MVYMYRDSDTSPVVQALVKMTFYVLDDPEFLDFNFSAFVDPELKPGHGPTQTGMYQLAIESRRGDRIAAAEFANTLCWTLRPVAFECFQRVHGPRPLEHRDWFYSKLFQFFEILLHDSVQVLGNGREGSFGPPRTDRPWVEGRQTLRGAGPSIEPDELEEAFSPGDQERIDWLELVQFCARAAPETRLPYLRARLQQLGQGKQRSGRGWSKNARRNQILVACIEEGRSALEICEALDKHLIPTTENMQKHGIATWLAAWEDAQFRRDVQSLISKVKKRNSVKP
jgi:hypothetical protein